MTASSISFGEQNFSRMHLLVPLVRNEKYQRLAHVLGRMAELPLEEWKECEKIFHLNRLQEGEVLSNIGDRNYKIVFILSGVIRSFTLTDKGKEIVGHFFIENELHAPFADFLQKTPCRLTVQALEEAEVLVASYEEFTQLYSRHQCWERVGRVLMEQNYLHKERREGQLLQKLGPERYEDFIRDYPHLLKRIPQYQIASYIGITPQSLSRLIKRKVEGEFSRVDVP